MIRREFCRTSLLATAAAGLSGRLTARKAVETATRSGDGCEAAPFPQTPGLTKYVAETIVNTKYEDIPPEVIELGKKTILDGLGLALAGSVSESGPIDRKSVV